MSPIVYKTEEKPSSGRPVFIPNSALHHLLFGYPKEKIAVSSCASNSCVCSNNKCCDIFESPGELESISCKSSETEMSDSEHDDDRQEEQASESSNINSSISKQRRFHQSDSYPQSLSDRIQHGYESKNQNAMSRSQSTPAITPSRRVIFPSYFRKNSFSQEPATATATATARPLTVDLSALDNFHDSLSLNNIRVPKVSPNVEDSPRYATTLTRNNPLDPKLTYSPKINPKTASASPVPASPLSVHDSLDIPKKLPKPGPSILRRTRSDMDEPSLPLLPLTPSATPCSDSDSSASPAKLLRTNLTRHSSIDETSCKRIKFDPRVFVVEFQRSGDEDIWFSSEEMNQFKNQAIKRIQQREIRMIPSGTGRIVGVRPNPSAMKAIFTNPALSAEDEECEEDCSSPLTKSFHHVLTSEIKSVLIVDPHDLILKLLTKGIKAMLPHVSITAAHNAGEALERIFDARENSPLTEGGCTHGFDLIIIEERLALMRSMYSRQNDEKKCDQRPLHQFPESGSGLVRNIRNEEINMLRTWKTCNSWESAHPRFALIIGISAHLDQDKDKMKYAGADMMWPKPPPPLDHNMRKNILQLLLKKRDRHDIHIKN